MDPDPLDRYKEIELVGEGSYGKVYKARDRFYGHVKKQGKKRAFIKDLKKEFEILKMLSHPNIICLIDLYETETEIVAVTDFAEGDLLGILQDDNVLPEPVVRDMKPQNILVTSGSVVKLCDFGFARSTNSEIFVMTSVKGTPLYMSPELIDEKPYDHSSDLWAMGCILYELFHGHPPFNTDRLAKLIDMILTQEIELSDEMSPEFKNFIEGLLQKDRDERMQWPDIIVHPFIKDHISSELNDYVHLIFSSILKVDEKCLGKKSHFTKPLTMSMAIKKKDQEDNNLKKNRPKRLVRQIDKKEPQSLHKMDGDKIY